MDIWLQVCKISKNEAEEFILHDSNLHYNI